MIKIDPHFQTPKDVCGYIASGMSDTIKLNLTNKVANFVKEKREAMGMTQKELAVHIWQDESKQQWVSAIESGRSITIITLSKILEGLNADVDIIEY